jgi:hypothetical protein
MSNFRLIGLFKVQGATARETKGAGLALYIFHYLDIRSLAMHLTNTAGVKAFGALI